MTSSSLVEEDGPEGIETSQRGSVDSATSATQIQLAICFNLMKKINLEIEKIDNEDHSPHSSRLATELDSSTVGRLNVKRRNWLVKSLGVLKQRVDHIMKEKINADE